MINRITTGWTLTRGFYLLAGLFLIVQALHDKQYVGMAFGAYFAAMGLFAFGCAAGSCGVQNKAYDTHAKEIEDVEFEEIKTK